VTARWPAFGPPEQAMSNLLRVQYVDYSPV
jgi:hypothetical protein